MSTKLYASLKVYVAAGLMILFWASAYVGIRAGLTGYSPGSLALFRYLIASFCMLFIYLRVLRFRRIAILDVSRAVILGIFGFAIYNVALNYGEVTVTAGAASFIVAQMPILLTLLGVFRRGERLKLWGWLGVVISVIGVGLITLGEQEHFHFDFGILFIFIAMLSGFIYSYFQKILLLRMRPVEFSACAMWGGTAAMFIYLPQLIKELPTASWHATLSAIYIGIFPVAIGFILWSYIISMTSTSKAASFLYLIPPVAVIVGWFWLKEIPTTLVIIGGFVALLGAIMANRGVISFHVPK